MGNPFPAVDVQRKPVDYLLISTPSPLLASRLRVQLEVSGIRTAESALGLEVHCRSLDWTAVLEAVFAMLSPVQRTETRIAMVNLGDDPGELHRAIFRARPLDALLQELHDEWFCSLVGQDRLAIHFQAMVQHPPGRIHGYECLMRGIGNDGMLIPPGRIFQAAATLDRLRVLDESCRRAAIRAAATLCGPGPELRFFINFLPSTIANPRRCLQDTLCQVQEAGLRPEQIAFEVVETDRVNDRRHLMDILRCFRRVGFKVALDDVGAGYSSLLNISHLRPDYIKLDGELVRRAARSAMEAKLVADLAETARQNGIITIAEGIETGLELRQVINSGIRISQGYFHARPSPTALSPEQTADILARVEQVVAVRAGA
jgi:EAL domain-containing protein (putative c-di-GMP-specific phosphodiesterase class I)